MPLECCLPWKGASKTRLLCLKTVRADSEQLKESGSTCTQGTRLHCSARLNSPKHLLECYTVFRHCLHRQLSYKEAQHPFSAIYQHQIIIFKNQVFFLSSCTTSHPETESCRGQHGENRGSMCMIPYRSKGLLNHVDSYCDCSGPNWNQASM